MKKILLAILIIGITGIAHAQSFPISATVYWTPNAVTDGVTSYTVTLNTNTPISVDPTTCTATECSAKVSLTVPTNTITVTAINMWGSGSSTLNFTAAAPGKPNIKIRVP